MNFKIVLNQMKFFAFIFIFSATFFLFSSRPKASPQYFTRSMTNNFLFTLKINHLTPSGEEKINHHLFEKNLETIAENNIDYPLIEGKEYTISITAQNIYGNFKSSFFQKGSPLSVFINGVRASESFGESGFKSSITKSFTFTPSGNKLILESVLENCKVYQFTGTNELQYRIVFPVKSASHTVTLKKDLDGEIEKLTDDSNPTLVNPNTKIREIPNLPPKNEENYSFLGYFKEITGQEQPMIEKVALDTSITENTTIVAKYTRTPLAKDSVSIFWGESLDEPKTYISNADILKNLADNNAFSFKENNINTKPSANNEPIKMTIVVNYKDGKDAIEIPVSITVKPLNEKYSLVAKDEISQTVGSPALLPADFIKNSKEGEALPENTDFSFHSNFDWNKVGKQTAKILITFEDKSTSEMEVSLNLKSRADLIYYLFEPEINTPTKTENAEVSPTNNEVAKEEPKNENPENEADSDNQAEPISENNKSESPDKNVKEDTTLDSEENTSSSNSNEDELEITEEPTAKGEANLNTDSTSEKKTEENSSLGGNRGKSKLSATINLESSVKANDQSPSESTLQKSILAKTGGLHSQVSLYLSLILSLLTILGGLSFMSKKAK